MEQVVTCSFKSFIFDSLLFFPLKEEAIHFRFFNRMNSIVWQQEYNEIHLIMNPLKGYYIKNKFLENI